MRWVELGADGGGDDGVRREDAVQPTEDDRLHTLAATLVTLQRHLDRAMKAVEPAALQAASPSNTEAVAGRPQRIGLSPWRPELPRAARCPHSEAAQVPWGTAEGVAS